MRIRAFPGPELPAETPALVYTEPGQVAVMPQPVPTAAPDEALIRVEASGICGSEIHGVKSRDPFRVPPLVMGHEFAGTRLDTGDRVVVNPLLTCGHCHSCTSGRENLCADRQLIGVHRPGGFARYAAVPTAALHTLPLDMGWAAAALVEPLANTVHGWRRTTPLIDPNRVAIIGAGAIGLMALRVARHHHPDADIAVTDLDTGRLDIASDLGATIVGPQLDGTYDLTIDAVGNQATRRSAMAALRPCGISLWYGLHDTEPGFDAQHLVRHEHHVLGSFGYTDDDFTTAITLAAKTDTSWLTHIGIDQAATIFRELMDGHSAAAKVIINFSRTER